METVSCYSFSYLQMQYTGYHIYPQIGFRYNTYFRLQATPERLNLGRAFMLDQCSKRLGNFVFHLL
jgi:hypothetical protein